MRKPYKGGYSTGYLTALLECVKDGPSWTEIYQRQPIIHNATRAKYMKWCKKRNLIKHITLKPTGVRTFYSKYTLTEEGRGFLKVIC